MRLVAAEPVVATEGFQGVVNRPRQFPSNNDYSIKTRNAHTAQSWLYYQALNRDW